MAKVKLISKCKGPYNVKFKNGSSFQLPPRGKSKQSFEESDLVDIDKTKVMLVRVGK